MSKPDPSLKQQQEFQKETSVTAKVVACICMYIFAASTIYFSYSHYNDIKQYLLLLDLKTKTKENKLQYLTTVSFYLALIMMGHWAISFLLTTFTNANNSTTLVRALTQSSRNCVQYFVVFLGLYAYLLLNQHFGLKKKELVLYANWFLASRVLHSALWIIDVKIGYSFRELGASLGVFTLFLMLLQSAGLFVFDLI